MKLLFCVYLLIGLLSGCKTNSCPTQIDEYSGMQVYSPVDEEPSFKDGVNDVISYLLDNIGDEVKESGQRTFVLVFIVNSEGDIISPRIYNKKDEDLSLSEKYLIQKLSNMPRWKPGKCNKKNVPVLVNLPIRVKLSND